MGTKQSRYHFPVFITTWIHPLLNSYLRESEILIFDYAYYLITYLLVAMYSQMSLQLLSCVLTNGISDSRIFFAIFTEFQMLVEPNVVVYFAEYECICGEAGRSV